MSVTNFPPHPPAPSRSPYAGRGNEPNITWMKRRSPLIQNIMAISTVHSRAWDLAFPSTAERIRERVSSTTFALLPSAALGLSVLLDVGAKE